MEPITTSLFELFKIGPGPSSSHTIGPMRAAFRFRRAIEQLPKEKLKAATGVSARLYGSLSATGKGHGTDRAVAAGFLGWEPATCDAEALLNLLGPEDAPRAIKVKNISIPFDARSIIFDKIQHSFPFRNTMIMRLWAGKRILLKREYYSVGGGTVIHKSERKVKPPLMPYPYGNMAELKKILISEHMTLDELMLENEKAVTGKDKTQVFKELDGILCAMEEAVEAGLNTEGVLPGPIKLSRKAPTLFRKAQSLLLGDIPDRFFIFLDAYTLAGAEENAACHRIVTAPTSGSAGVIPGVLHLLKHQFSRSRESLREGLLAAAAIGFIVKHNASIAGAEVGCQGEIGVASSMAAALLAHVDGRPIEVVENAAEITLEHHLGMTCDPVKGYVQIPCIERNVFGAVDAYNAYLLAAAGDPKKQKLNFDEVVKAMLETGRDMSTKYKETSKGGLAVCATHC